MNEKEQLRLANNMLNIIENLEDYIFEILKGNCTPDQWDAICAINPEMVSLESRHVLKIIQIIYEGSGKEG